MSQKEFEEMVHAWAHDPKMLEIIERDIGKLKSIVFTKLTVKIYGEKSARLFHRETLEKDLNWLNKQGMH